MATPLPHFVSIVCRSITESQTPDMPLLTSTLVILFAVAKLGGGGISLAAGAPEGGPASALSSDAAAAAVGGGVGAGGIGGVETSPELAALAEGGAWGAVYDALKGPCMARATELQQANVAGAGGKKGGGDGAEAVSADLTICLDNMARCAEVRRSLPLVSQGHTLCLFECGAFLCFGSGVKQSAQPLKGLAFPRMLGRRGSGGYVLL